MKAYRALRASLGWLFRLVYRVRIVGREHEPTDRAYLTCANHTSYIDPVLVAIALKREQQFLAKRALTSHWFLRALFRMCHVLTVQAGGNNLSTFRTAIQTLRAGGCVAIFPQGTRMPDQPPAPEQAMGGLITIAGGAQADILPVSILSRSGQNGKPSKPRPFHKTTVVIGKPIPASIYRAIAKTDGTAAAAAYCFAQVCGPICAATGGTS